MKIGDYAILKNVTYRTMEDEFSINYYFYKYSLVGYKCSLKIQYKTGA